MRAPLEFLFPPEIGVELIYSFVIIACSFMIYYATKEVYELSSYKGIKYFRQSFLFFAIAYFFRYFIIFFLAFFNIEVSSRLIFDGTLFIFLYFSSMAVFYLLYSVMWKKWNHSMQRIYMLNILALIIALIGTLFRGVGVSLILNIILLLFVSFILFKAYKDSKDRQRRKSLFIIYPLLFIFWILNVVNIMIPKFLELYQLVIYLISILLFMIILYKVLKKIGA